RVSVALGQPDGSLQVSFQLANPAVTGEPDSLIAGDFDRDGVLDFLTVSRGAAGDSRVSLLFGAGDGDFRLSLDFWLSSAPAVNTDSLRHYLETGQIENGATTGPVTTLQSFLPGLGGVARATDLTLPQGLSTQAPDARAARPRPARDT